MYTSSSESQDDYKHDVGHVDPTARYFESTKCQPVCTQGVSIEFGLLPFEESIKRRAQQIYNEIDMRSVRKKNRKGAICYCIYQAYLDSGYPQDVPLILSKVGGLTCQEADSSIRRFSSKLTKPREHNSGFITMDALIDCYCRSEHIDLREECIEEVKEMWRTLVRKDSSVSTRQPRNMVAGLIWMFIKLNQNDAVLDSTYSTVFCYQPQTVENAYKLLCNVSKRERPLSSLSDRVARRDDWK